MAMTFLEPTSWAMIVMDGNRPVAKARKRAMGVWELLAVDACWVDKRARTPLRDDFPAGHKDMFSQYPQFLAVKTKGEARKIMQGLAENKPYKAEEAPKAQPQVTISGRNKKTARETHAV